MSNNTELKPCPFCGGDASHNGGGNSVYGRLWWSVWCNTCQFEVRDREVWDPVKRGYLDASYPPKECFKTWNTRAAPKVKPLVWDDDPHGNHSFGINEGGEKVFGEFLAEDVVATCKTAYYGIYRASNTKFMWVNGTLDNIRYSTYRKPPLFEKVEIPWFNSVETAKAAAQADYEHRILDALEN